MSLQVNSNQQKSLYGETTNFLPNNMQDLDNKVQTVSQEITTQSTLDKEQKQFVRTYVKQFLHPYITGQITASNEPKEREDLLTSLLKIVPNLQISQIDDFVQYTFSRYLKTAALGLYTNQLKSHGCYA